MKEKVRKNCFKTHKKTMLRQYRFAVSSFAIEGVHLSTEASAVFEQCIEEGCSFEVLDERLRPLWGRLNVTLCG